MNTPPSPGTPTSAYMDLHTSYEKFSQDQKTPQIKEEFAKAIVENFITLSPESIQQMNEQEQRCYKQHLSAMISEYIDRCISSEPPQPILLEEVSDPVKLYDRLEKHKQFLDEQGKNGIKIGAMKLPSSPTAIDWEVHTNLYTKKQKEIDELTLKLNEAQMNTKAAQMGTMIDPSGRKVDLLGLGLVDIKLPGNGDRTTRHFREVLPMFQDYKKNKSKLPKEDKIAALREIISYSCTIFPDASSVVYWFQKGNFQAILDFSL